MSTVGQYELIGRVAHSGGSTVWKAHDPDLDRLVAIKQVGAGAADILRGEAQVLAALDHPNVVRVYDFIEGGPSSPSFLVEEWVEGATLARVRDRHGKLAFEQALEIVRGALRGLAYCHDKRLLHGDLAPGNIIIDLAGVSRLIDFGGAQRVGAARPGPSSATLAFAAPEVLAGGPATAGSDVYAAGAVLADLLREGATPVVGSELLSGIRGPVAGVLAVALAADPSSRHADAGELLAALEEASARTLGAGWTAVAGVGGLVASTLGGGGVALITGAGAAAVGGEAVAIARSGAAPVAKAVGRAAGRWWAGPIGIGASAAVVIAVIGLVAVVSHRTSPAPRPGGSTAVAAALTSSRPGSSPAGPGGRATVPGPGAGPATSTISSASSPSSSSASASAATAVTTRTSTKISTNTRTIPAKKIKALDGTYRYSYVRTSITGTFVPIGQQDVKGSRDVPLTADCETGMCGFRLGSGSGELRFAYSGGRWAVRRSAAVQCLDAKKVVVGKARGSTAWVLSAVRSGSRVTGFTGTLTYSQTSRCTSQKGDNFVITYRVVMTRTRS